MPSPLLRILALLIAIPLASSTAFAQDKKLWKVGILWHAANLEEEMVMFEPFAQGMRELGYVEGRNVIFDHTFVDENYDRFEARASELVHRKVDIILASVPAAAAAANRVTKTIPIVFASSGDPVKLGLVESLRRPGGTMTGLSLFSPEITTKHLELLREIVPGISRVAILGNSNNSDAAVALKEAERAAPLLKLHATPVGVKAPEEFVAAFESIRTARAEGMIVLGDPMLRVNRKLIIALAATARLPAVYGPRDYVEDGGLVAYGACVPCNFRRSAAFIDKILKGVNPAELPVEQPTRLDLVINLKTATTLGIEIPPTLLARADGVIE
jgi:putative ABC transport system substrate-binding protein